MKYCSVVTEFEVTEEPTAFDLTRSRSLSATFTLTSDLISAVRMEFRAGDMFVGVSLAVDVGRVAKEEVIDDVRASNWLCRVVVVWVVVWVDVWVDVCPYCVCLVVMGVVRGVVHTGAVYSMKGVAGLINDVVMIIVMIK